MWNLINRIQQDYSGKPIYLIISPMLNGAARDSQQSVLNSVTSAQVKLLDLGKIESAVGWAVIIILTLPPITEWRQRWNCNRKQIIAK